MDSSRGDILLRDVTEDDLGIFFEQQLDEVANRMAAFTAEDPADREAFTTHWSRILGDDTITIKAILFDEQVVGYIVSFKRFGLREVSYWIGRDHWGRGFATAALSAFLTLFTSRPLHARAAKDNIASLRVLEKCGFTIEGDDKGFSNARNEEVEEYILKLEAGEGETASSDAQPLP